MKIQYTAASSQTAYSVPWPVMQVDDLIVYSTPVGQSASDNTNILTYGTAYNFDPPYNQDTAFPDGWSGNIVLVDPSTMGDVITLVRYTEAPPISIYSDSFPLSANALNTQSNQESFAEEDLQEELLYKTPNYQNTIQITEADMQLPQLGEQCVWQMNADRTGIISVPITEGGDAALLRAELIATSPPGSNIVGASIDVGLLDYTGNETGLFIEIANVLQSLQNQITSLEEIIDGISGYTSGDLKVTSNYDFFDSTFIRAWGVVRYSGANNSPVVGTIGSALSGATWYSGDDAINLYSQWWLNPGIVVNGGKGTSAANDFNANKTMNMPCIDGRSVTIAGNVARFLKFETVYFETPPLINGVFYDFTSDSLAAFNSYFGKIYNTAEPNPYENVDDVIVATYVNNINGIYPSPLTGDTIYYVRTMSRIVSPGSIGFQFYPTMQDACLQTNLIALLSAGDNTAPTYLTDPIIINYGGGSPEIASTCLDTFGSPYAVQTPTQIAPHVHPPSTGENYVYSLTSGGSGQYGGGSTLRSAASTGLNSVSTVMPQQSPAFTVFAFWKL